MAFTDLLAASVGLLPGVACFADRVHVQRAVDAARASPDLHRWPTGCRALLGACEAFLAGELTALRNNEIGTAADGRWPDLAQLAWLARRDIGDGLDAAA